MAIWTAMVVHPVEGATVFACFHAYGILFPIHPLTFAVAAFTVTAVNMITHCGYRLPGYDLLFATAREHDYIVARQIGGVFMKVALIGVTGAVGSRVAKELLARNHTVTGISRHPETASKIDGVAYKAGDVADKNTLAKLFSGHDAVISSVRFLDSDPRTLIDAVKQSGVKRYLVVGGAGTLELQPGLSVLDAGKVPEAHVAEVRAGKIFLDMIRAENNLDWSFLSPSSMLMPGQRTGKFRLGGDALLRDDSGKPVRLVGYNLDITDRYRAAEQIRESEGRFRALADSHGATHVAIVPTSGQFDTHKHILAAFVDEVRPLLEDD